LEAPPGFRQVMSIFPTLPEENVPMPGAEAAGDTSSTGEAKVSV